MTLKKNKPRPNDTRVPPELGDASSYIKAQIKVDPVPGGSLQSHEQFIQWPLPQRTDVAFAGKAVPYEVFSGKAVAYVPVGVAEDAPPGHAPLTLRVTYQACGINQSLMC